MYTKDDKWLLASHLQKSIRRGWSDEAAWAAQHLHGVDRAYLAYRLSVIAVEDVGAGDMAAVAQFLHPEIKWGAKRFGPVKNEEDQAQWIEVARVFAEASKDRTPCEWMACARWLPEFEKLEGPWQELNPLVCVEQAYDTTQPWWWRGLMAWRAAGTDRFPSERLPECQGAWEEWVNDAPTEAQIILTGYGERQREAHPVFFPLAVHDRLADQTTALGQYNCGPVLKCGSWISAALDNHTAEGKKAISLFWRQQPSHIQQVVKSAVGYERMNEVVARMMFWTEGGIVNQAPVYATATTISQDIKKAWLKSTGLSGRWLVDHLVKPEAWHQARLKVVQEVDYQPPRMS